MNIYLDCDDVVADFKGYAQKVLKKKLDVDERLPQCDWDILKNHTRIYRDLPVKTGAEELVHWCQEWCLQKNAGLFFLTALPKNNDIPYAVYDKVNWARKHFRGIPLFIGPYSYDKWKHCERGDILIDDRNSNCREWEDAGGLAHIYRNWPECHEWLVQQTKPFAFLSSY
jgi:hypothetical protein